VLHAGFLKGARGDMFHVLHTPPAGTATRGAVLHVHAFAEELNKSRRMLSVQARQLAAQGFIVMLPDHYGCGDSGGDHGDATWDGWLNDLELALAHLASLFPGPPVLWGLRSGCLLINALTATRGIEPRAQVYWQPVHNGEQFLTQFLRLRVAAGMMASGEKETTRALRDRLDAGESLEVAGYGVSAALAHGLDAARLSQPPGSPLCWLDVVPGAEPRLSPASRKVVDNWLEAGLDITAAAHTGEPFWTTQEIREVPALVEHTTAFIQGLKP